MKSIIRHGLFIIFVCSRLIVCSQENCKVLKPEIEGTYKGKCKNGLAHGKGLAIGIDRYEGIFIRGLPQGQGTYSWANGNIYSGEWFEGMRHGIGRYTMKTAGHDSVQDGLWQQDIYMGPKPPKPDVIYNMGVDRYTFQKNNTTKLRVLIDFYQNGTRNIGISDFLMSTTSGTDVKIGPSIGYDFVTFPVTIKISYTTWNKLHTIQSNVKFDFEISEPGDWSVQINN